MSGFRRIGRRVAYGLTGTARPLRSRVQQPQGEQVVQRVRDAAAAERGEPRAGSREPLRTGAAHAAEDGLGVAFIQCRLRALTVEGGAGGEQHVEEPVLPPDANRTVEPGGALERQLAVEGRV